MPKYFMLQNWANWIIEKKSKRAIANFLLLFIKKTIDTTTIKSREPIFFEIANESLKKENRMSGEIRRNEIAKISPRKDTYLFT